MIVKDDQALEMACRVKVEINSPKRSMAHRRIVWVDFTLRGAGNRLFFRVKSTSRTTGNLSRCTDGGNRRIFGGMTPVSDGELPHCSVRLI